MALAAAGVAHGAAEDVRREIATRLDQPRASLPAAGGSPDAAAADTGAAARERGKALWTRKFKDGKSLASCYPNGGRRVAALYPLYDSRLKRVVTLEMSINQCLKSHHEALYEAADPQTMGAITAYVRSLAAGQKISVRVPYFHGEEAWTLQGQIRACLERMGAAPFPAGSDELNNLEYFLTYLSQGLPIARPAEAAR
jgi:sulfur-oxidizing protein SoxA